MNDFFSKLGFKNLTSDKTDELIEIASETILDLLAARVGELISEEDMPEFSALLDEQDSDKLASFLQKHGLDLDELTTEAVEEYQLQMLNIINS